MYLSSRFACCVGIAALLAAGAARAELAARPAFAGIRPTIVARPPRFPASGIAPTIVGRRDGYPRAGIRPTVVPHFRRGVRYGTGGYGGYGLGYDGTTTTDYGPAAALPPTPLPIDAPPPFLLPPAPAPCPQIVEIGGGLSHKVRTRVVSGASCRR